MGQTLSAEETIESINERLQVGEYPNTLSANQAGRKFRENNASLNQLILFNQSISSESFN